MHKFINDITFCEKELLNLKSFYQKRANQLRTIVTTQKVNFTLDVNDQYITGVLLSTQYATISVAPQSDTEPLIAFYLDVNNLEDRWVYLEGGVKEDGTFYYELNVQHSDNQEDWQKYNQSQTVSVEYNVVFVSTSKLTSNVTYVNKW